MRVHRRWPLHVQSHTSGGSCARLRSEPRLLPHMTSIRGQSHGTRHYRTGANVQSWQHRWGVMTGCHPHTPAAFSGPSGVPASPTAPVGRAATPPSSSSITSGRPAIHIKEVCTSFEDSWTSMSLLGQAGPAGPSGGEPAGIPSATAEPAREQVSAIQPLTFSVDDSSCVCTQQIPLWVCEARIGPGRFDGQLAPRSSGLVGAPVWLFCRTQYGAKLRV